MADVAVTTTFTYGPATGRSKVDLTSWASDAAFPTTPVAGDQIEFVDSLTVGTDGVVSGTTGTYTLRHVIASTGKVEAISYQVGKVARATFTYTRGNNYTSTTLVDPVEPYLFQEWSAPPVGGEQLTTQTSAGTFDTSGNFETDVEAQIPVVYTELDGTTWLLEIDTTGLGEAVDTTPADFSFTPLIDQARDVLVTSNTITILGVDPGADVPLTISGDATSEYSISTDGGATWGPFASTDTVVHLDDQVRLRHRTGIDYSDAVTTTVDIGGRARNFTSTTLADTVKPTISLVGGNQSIVQGETWVDPGYTASDNADGDLTTNVVVTGSVDTSTLGQYTLTYSATDSAGNTAQTTRTVSVVEFAPDDQTAPVISLVGGNQTLTAGDVWAEPGYTATDDVDGDLTDQVTVTGSVDTTKAGSYSLVYSVTDAAGNTGSTNRTVTVLPVIQYPLDIPAPASRTFTAERLIRLASNEPLFIMQSGEILDFDFDLTTWLAEQGDGIAEGTHSITEIADGLDVLGSGTVPGTDRVKVWLEAGQVKDSESSLVQLLISSTGYRTGVFQFRVVIINRMAA